MQSLKTGWGIEAEATREGKKKLERIRKKNPERFKYSRIYLVRQLIPLHHDYCEPFRLTSIKDVCFYE
jgi:hypothetical protein